MIKKKIESLEKAKKLVHDSFVCHIAIEKKMKRKEIFLKFFFGRILFDFMKQKTKNSDKLKNL